MKKFYNLGACSLFEYVLYFVNFGANSQIERFILSSSFINYLLKVLLKCISISIAHGNEQYILSCIFHVVVQA